MKADKILFGATCLGMGLLINMVANKNNPEPIQKQSPQTTLFSETVKLKNLSADTVEISQALKSDTLKLIRIAK